MRIIADSHIPYLKDYFAGYGDLILKPGRLITQADTKNADILLVRSITPVDAQLLKDSTVNFVGSVTAGADHLDTKWLDEVGIRYSVASGFNAPPVADYIISVMAALIKKDLLPKSTFKVGVIGIGNVGRLVVDRLKLFDCDIFLCDPLRAQKEQDFTSVDLDDLSDLDLISLHVPLVRGGDNPTYHFINKAFLQRQKPGCILLNASRGAVINSDDLLQYGAHLNWCFDVFEKEPGINQTILAKSLIATPHIAGYSRQSKIRGVDMIYRIACEQGIITPKAINPIEMPQQTLRFAAKTPTWEDIVLGIFNPLLITTMMRSTLLNATEHGPLFDEMRNQFNYRYEFAYTKVSSYQLAAKDQLFLEKLGMVFD